MKGKHPIEAEELQAYLDDELAAERRAAVEQHLVACVDCRRLADELRQVSTSLQAWQVEPAPVHLRPPAFETAKQRLLTVAGERRRLTWKLAMAFGGVAATVLVIAAITLPNLLRSPEPLPRTESVPTPMYMPPPEREETLADREPQASVPVRKQAKPSEGLLGAKEHPEAEVEVLGEADEVAKLATREERGRVAMMAADKAAPRQMIAHEVSLRISVKDFDA
ncbi:MAG: zf-HC2 domain-containing protein, partial [Acidobacteria bacterium]|nr:zf-HC2 domain-containing protein [Acidobacteriota bacterium]